MGRRLMEGFNAIARDLGVEGHAAGLPPPVPEVRQRRSTYHDRLEFLWHRELFGEGLFMNPRC